MAFKCPKCLHHLFEMWMQWSCLLGRFISLAVATEMCPESKWKLVTAIIIAIISFILSIPQCKAICSKYPDGIVERCCKNTCDMLLLIIQLVLSLAATGVLIDIIMKKEQLQCELISVKFAAGFTAVSIFLTLNLCKLQFPNCCPRFEEKVKYSELSSDDHRVNIDQH